MSISLLLLSPQKDFCSPNGSAFIEGADKDSVRTATFIKNNISKIDRIHIAMNCHPFFHISHPNFWKDENGNDVKPFTTISHSDFISGKYSPKVFSLRPRVEEYLMMLESQGRHQHMIWPERCRIGSDGNSIQDNIWEALSEWEKSKIENNLNYIIKTKNPLTEQYSAFQAEVPDVLDPTTRVNFALVDTLKSNDMIYVAGQSLSHEVCSTLRDLFSYISPKKVTFIRDCSSSIKGYEKFSFELLDRYIEKGLNLITSDKLI